MAYLYTNFAEFTEAMEHVAVDWKNNCIKFLLVLADPDNKQPALVDMHMSKSMMTDFLKDAMLRMPRFRAAVMDAVEEYNKEIRNRNEQQMEHIRQLKAALDHARATGEPLRMKVGKIPFTFIDGEVKLDD